MAATVNVHEAKTHFSKLLARVEKGEEVIVARAGTPVARLVPIQPAKGPRKPGTAKGMFTMHDNFDDPLPPEIAKAFGL